MNLRGGASGAPLTPHPSCLHTTIHTPNFLLLLRLSGDMSASTSSRYLAVDPDQQRAALNLLRAHPTPGNPSPSSPQHAEQGSR